MRINVGKNSVVGGIFLIIFGLMFFLASFLFVNMTPESMIDDALEEIVVEEGIDIDDDDVMIMIQGEINGDIGYSSSFDVFSIISYFFMAIGILIVVLGIVMTVKALKNKNNVDNYQYINDQQMYNQPMNEQSIYNQSMNGQTVYNQPMNLQSKTYVLNGVTYNMNGERVD